MKAHLSDLERELWLRLRDSNQIVWTTRQGKEISIKEMETSHLINCINMINNYEDAMDHIGDFDPLELYD
jgi:hypothetical protein